MPDTDGTTGTASQAAQYGSEVLTELQAAVRMAEVPVPPASTSAPETPQRELEPAPQPVTEPRPAPATENAIVTKEQVARIQEIVDRAKADIARIVAGYEARRADFARSVQAGQDEERKRKAEELIARIKAGGTPAL